MKTLKELVGVYVGFSPTDESAVQLGEMEMTITENTVKLRMATGLEIQETSFPTDLLAPLSGEELEHWHKVNEHFRGRISVFRGLKNRSSMLILFVENPAANEPAVNMTTGTMGDIICPTILLSEAQVARGDYETAIQRLEAQVRVGCFPRLRNGGRAES